MKRRDVLLAAAAAIPVSGLGLSASAGQGWAADPLVDLVARWKFATGRFNAACALPDGGDFDSPECIRWSNEYLDLEDQIKRTPITSLDGVLAILDMIDLDSRNRDGRMPTPIVSWWHIEMIRSWAQLMEGAA